MKMTSFREDDCSATRCAKGVSAIDFLEKQTKSTSSSSVTITPTSTDEKNASSNEKNQQQNDKSLHDTIDDDEARAFRSQFDEIKCASRMLEYSKNNAYNRFQGPAGRVPSAPLQKRTCETGLNSFHQRSHSHSIHTQQTNRQMLKHQRSISSIQGLSFNGNSSAFKFCLPPTPYGFDNPLHGGYFDDSNSVNANDDTLMKFRDIENGSGRFGFNNNRFGSNADEWDDSSSGYLSSGYPSTPLSNGPFTPLPPTPPSTYSPSTPYFAQPHSLLDDDELLEKAKRLEEERLLLQIQQRKLDDAIAAHQLHHLRYHHSDPSLSETEARYKLNNTPPLVPRKQMKPVFGNNKLTIPVTRFQNFQEPIGTPIRKSGYITPPSTTPTGNSNSSLSTSAPTFSLFSNPPALSLNHNLLNQQQKYHRAMSSDNINGKFSGYPLTPSSSPPKNNDEGYFGPYKNASNIWINNNNNNENSYNPLTPTTMPASSAFYFRAPLYSSPVDEREEDSLFTDEYFNLNNKKDYENNFTNFSFANHWVD
jgi:hypothetical protein